MEKYGEIFYHFGLSPKQYVVEIPDRLDAEDEDIPLPDLQEPSKLNGVEGNIKRLMHYSLWVSQHLSYKADTGGDLDSWAPLLEQGLEEPVDGTPSIYEDFFKSDSEVFISYLAGTFLRDYFESKYVQSIEDLYTNPAEFKLNLSLHTFLKISELHFAPEPKGCIHELYYYFLNEDKNFGKKLSYYLNSIGVLPEIANLRGVREDNKLLLWACSNNSVLEASVNIPSPVIGLNSITGIDGSGKSTVLQHLPFPILKAAYLDEISPYVDDLSPNSDLKSTVEQKVKVASFLKEKGQYTLLQKLLTESRKTLASHTSTNIDQGRIHLSPYQGLIMERNLLCNIAYTDNSVEFVRRCQSEFEGESLLPEKTFLLRTDMDEIFNRLSTRDSDDFFDSASAKTHSTRMLKYLILAHLIPERIKVVSAHNPSTGNLKSPQQLHLLF